MRKFAVTLLLGLGMATASFAGTIANTDAKAEVAPKYCYTIYTTCGKTVTICGLSNGEEWNIDTWAIDAQVCP